jgi:hypothetical protein
MTSRFPQPIRWGGKRSGSPSNLPSRSELPVKPARQPGVFLQGHRKPAGGLTAERESATFDHRNRPPKGVGNLTLDRAATDEPVLATIGEAVCDELGGLLKRIGERREDAMGASGRFRSRSMGFTGTEFAVNRQFAAPASSSQMTFVAESIPAGAR